MKNPKVSVAELTPTPDMGNLRAFLTLRLGPLELRKCRLVQQPGQRPFVSPPQESWVDGEGKRRYHALAAWPPEWRDVIQDAVLEAWETHPDGIKQLANSPFRNEVMARAGIGGAQ